MKIEKDCLVCKKKFMVFKCHANRGNGKFCSRSCLGKSRIGTRNSNWRGGIIKRQDGRIYVYAKGHENATLNGGSHILSYRLEASKKIGRPLKEYEIVHHINGDVTDNRAENLEVITQAEHAKKHMQERERLPSGRLK